VTEHDYGCWICQGTVKVVAGCRTYRASETARARLIVFGEWMYQRDDLVRDSVALGIPKTEIAELTGLARTTIDRILRRDR
jgi:hypothetical protein